MIQNWPLRDKLTAFLIALLFAIPLMQSAPTASAAPPAIGGVCGGQNWHVFAPVDCRKTKVIDGVAVTIHLRESADGFVTIVFTLNHSVPYDTLIHVTSHLGNSDAGGPQTDPTRHIPAGGTTGALVLPGALCGQLDIRWKYNDSRGRVSGPYVNNNSCLPPVTTPPATSPTSVPGTTSPRVPTSLPATTPPTTPPVGGTVVRTVPPGTTPLPPTGRNSSGPALGGVVAAGVGAVLIVLSRRRKLV